jgi:hypothetical protein
LMVAILTRVRWNLSVVLICISFMARGGEHFWPFVLLLLSVDLVQSILQTSMELLQ